MNQERVNSELQNGMREQVFSLPQLIRDQYEDLEPKVRKVMTTPQIFSLQKIILTGCGDSYAAAMAMKTSFEQLTSLPVEVVTAVDLARYYNPTLLGTSPNNPLVVVVSNSGEGARIGEAVQRVRKYGALVLGITKSAYTLLGRHSSAVVPLSIPPAVSAPGTRSYLVAEMALLLLAIRIGEVRGCYTMDVAMEMRYDMLAQADSLEALLPDMDKEMLALAKEWKGMEAWDFVGAGPDYATAWFGHAKVMEATGQYSMHINSEEWLHLNFFMRKSRVIGTVVVASSSNAALSRTQEMILYAKKLKRPLLVITDKRLPALDSEGVRQVITPSTAFASSFPIVQFSPICLLFGYVMVLIGETEGRGCSGLWDFCKDGASVKNSKIEIL